MEELYKIMNKFGVIAVAPELKSLYSKYFTPKKSVLFALCYDLKKEIRLNVELIKLFGSTLNASNARLGALCKNNKAKTMQLCERDLPGLDMENLIMQGKTGDDNESLMDVMHRAIDMIAAAPSSYLVIIYKKEPENISTGNISSVQCVLPKELKLVFVNLGDFCGLDLEIFIENNIGKFIDLKGKEFASCISQLLAAIGPLT